MELKVNREVISVCEELYSGVQEQSTELDYILPDYFPEIFRISRDCRFDNCTHTHEPGCAVLQALEEGRVALSRYTSYLSILGDKEEGKYRAAY